MEDEKASPSRKSVNKEHNSDMSDMEEGELEENSEDEVIPKHRRSPTKEKLSIRRMEPREDPITKHDRPLPSPVESDDENTLTVDMDALETFGVAKQPKPKVYENPSQDSFVLGFDPNSQEAQKRKEERAKRFGIVNTSSVASVNDEELKKLYESLGLSEIETSVGFGERGIRLEAVHLRGTDNMSTEDVFSYFKDHTPKFIEWIDDSSCNVIWHDKLSAAKAVLSKSIDPNASDEKQQDKTSESMETGDDENKKEVDKAKSTEPKESPVPEEDDDELNLLSSDEDENMEKKKEEINKPVSKQTDEKAEDVEMEGDSSKTSKQSDEKETKSNNTQFCSKNLIKRVLPPGNWRIGLPSEKAKFLFMRFANKADKKRPGAEKRSKYYREYGNPNFGGMKGLISSSRKRRLVNSRNRQEVQEARNAVRKTEKFYHGIPEETTFDKHLREAKRAKNMYTVAAKNSDLDDEENESEDEPSYMLNQYYSNVDDDLGWGQSNTVEGEEEKPEGQEEELDFELELGELMKKAPNYRVGRMYADDLEEELKIKKEAAAEITRQMLLKRDARSQIDEKRYRKESPHHQHHHKSHKHRRKHHTQTDDDILIVNLQNDGSEEEEQKQNELIVEGEDLRQKVHKRKEGHRSHHKRRKERHRRDRKKDVAENVEDSPVEDLVMDDVPESNFKYEKLRIQVDPDDV